MMNCDDVSGACPRETTNQCLVDANDAKCGLIKKINLVEIHSSSQILNVIFCTNNDVTENVQINVIKVFPLSF